jgi:hypothetical protein
MLNLILQHCSLFAGGGYTLRCLAPDGNAHPVSFDKFNRFYFAKPYTLRIAITEVALEDLSIGRIECHGAERACAYTRTASNADIIINDDFCQFIIASDRLYRAYVHTGRILALLAGHRDIQTFILPFDHPDPAAGRVRYTIMRNRTHKLTQLAARALLVIDM